MTDKELRATDLMIGDWVNVTLEGETFKGRVTSIDGDTEEIKVSLYTAPLGWEDGDDFDEIEPIPLTAEILEKNGWKCNNTYQSYSCDYASFELRLERNFYIVEVEGYEEGYGAFTSIEYLHELQHLLKLCGISKNIVL